MTYCYLIAHIDTKQGRIVRVQPASEFPVTSAGHGTCQALLAKRPGYDYAMAEKLLLESCFGSRATTDFHQWATRYLDPGTRTRVLRFRVGDVATR